MVIIEIHFYELLTMIIFILSICCNYLVISHMLVHNIIGFVIINANFNTIVGAY